MEKKPDKQAVKPGRRQLKKNAAGLDKPSEIRLPGQPSGKFNIQDFCDMKLFEQVLSDWAQSTGLATVAMDNEGRYISGYYNFTDFCEKLTRMSPEGLRRCTECDKSGSGVYQCHAGLVDFSEPITLEDGTVLGSVLGGQVLPHKPDEAKFRATARELGLDEHTYLEALHRVNVRNPEQIKAAAHLLHDVVNLFVRTSYAARQSARSLRERTGIITSLSKIYFCDYFIDLDKDYFRELDATRELHEFIGESGSPASGLLIASAGKFLKPQFIDGYQSFTDLATLKERMGQRQSLSYEFMGITLGWCRGTFITVSRDKAGQVAKVIYAVQVIQEEKQKELTALEQLRNAVDEANRANQVKTDFLARMSHDMRTPLTTIIGLSDIVSERYKDQELQKCFGVIKDSSQYLLSILNDILDMQKLAGSKMKVHPVLCREAETARAVERIIRPMAEAKKINFSAVLNCQKVGCCLKIDTRLVQRLIMNLLNNAVKYTPAGGEVKWTTLIFKDGPDQVICRHIISDNGPGMSEAFQQVMYEPFTQAEANHSSKGSGLGLAIVKKLVDLLGGTIQCCSVLGKGTTFTVTLPHTKATPGETEAYLKGEQTVPEDGVVNAFHVLICEDNEINAEIIKRLLLLKNITSERARDGAEAVQMVLNNQVAQEQRAAQSGPAVQQAQDGSSEKTGPAVQRKAAEGNKPYQAILMDIRMPVLDGCEAARRIRQFNKVIPIIALSANSFQEDVEKSLASGMNAHLAKPIDMKKLLAVLQQFLRPQT